VRAHGDGELNQHVDGVSPRVGRLEPEQRCEQCRTIWFAGRVLIHHFYLIALEDRDIHVLTRFIAAVVLDHEETWRRHFEHEAISRDGPGRPPHLQVVPLTVHT
jgi:hypothetical protein